MLLLHYSILDQQMMSKLYHPLIYLTYIEEPAWPLSFHMHWCHTFILQHECNSISCTEVFFHICNNALVTVSTCLINLKLKYWSSDSTAHNQHCGWTARILHILSFTWTVLYGFCMRYDILYLSPLQFLSPFYSCSHSFLLNNFPIAASSNAPADYYLLSFFFALLLWFHSPFFISEHTTSHWAFLCPHFNFWYFVSSLHPS